jgi:hypothetical protein
MESLPARGGPLYWLLVGMLLPVFNWWLGLWVVVLARNATPLVVVVPLLLAAESVAVSRLLRGGSARTRSFGTAVLLLVTTFAWSCGLTLVAFSVQENLFTF